LLDELGLGVRLGQVDQKRSLRLIGKVAGLEQMLLRNSIRSVRGDRRDDKRIVLPLVDETLGVGEARFPGLIIWSREIYDRFTQHAADTGLLGLIRDRVLEVVHV